MSRHLPKLSTQDAVIVDLLLNHGTAASGGVTRMSFAPSQPRLAAATKLLNLLGHLPQEEPPVDLTARTLRHIDRADARQVGHPAPVAKSTSANIH